jgi:7,8-dihydropterin-6-yl-methyl-4-(beta-D-ribofuranosyl)aminobenzene 5'-phosphate synthase
METANSVEIIILVDNYINGFLSSNQLVQRPRIETVNFGLSPGQPLRAEFGFSAIVKIRKDENVFPLLFDAGVGKETLLFNARTLNIDLTEIQTIVLSHGHPDHTAAIVGAVCAIGRKGLPIIVHPEARVKRVFRSNSQDSLRDLPFFFDERRILECGAKIEYCKEPTSLAADTAYVTGQIPRVTGFEKGMPPNTHYQIRRGGRLVHDTCVFDDQGLVVNLRDEGLIVVTGCAHSGIVNTVKYAQRITGVDKICAVVGGFHLTGSYFEPIVGPTVDALRDFAPKAVIPAHCTGLKAFIKIADTLPKALIENSVGSTFQF